MLYPTPIRRQDWIWPSAAVLLAVAPVGPLGVVALQHDFPNPRAAARSVDLLTSIYVPTQSALTTSVRPIGQTDWPNPRGAAFPSDLRGTVVNLLETTLGFAPGPLGILNFQTDWPVPKGKVFPSDLRGFTDNPIRNVLVPTPAIKRQSDWPLPPIGRQFPISLRTWTHNPLENTLAPVVLGPLGIVNFQTDWPVPKGPKYPLENQGYLQNTVADFGPAYPSHYPLVMVSGRARELPTGHVLKGSLGADAWTLGKANIVSPTAPNRTLTVVVDGITLYIAAKLTND